MRTRLSFTFLGPFNAFIVNGPGIKFRSDMERAVIAYIIEESKASYSRSFLAELCWPGQTSKVSHNNLRQVLFGIRKALRDSGVAADIFVADDHADAIKINPKIEIQADTKEFRQCLLGREKQSPGHEIPPESARLLTTATDLYRGEFLEGNHIFNRTIEFYNWVAYSRRFYLRKTLKAMEQLSSLYENLENFDLAYDYATRQVQLDPLKETAHLQIIRILARDGRRSAALEQYEACRQLLDQSLGIKPNAKIEALYRQILKGTYP